MLDDAEVPNAQNLKVLTLEQADVIRTTTKSFVEGQENPYSLPAAAPETQPGSAIAVQSNSQLETIASEAQQLSLGVVTILQELGVKQRLVDGHQQGLMEIAAFETGRSAMWESFAQQQIQNAQQSAKNHQEFNLQKAMQELGVSLPGERLPGLRKKTSDTLNNLRKSASQCTSNPWK